MVRCSYATVCLMVVGEICHWTCFEDGTSSISLAIGALWLDDDVIAFLCD